MKTFILKIAALKEIWVHFGNPLLVTLLRLGLLRLPYFAYRLRAHGRRYTMLARPSTQSLADLFVLREVFIQETYGHILPLLATGPVRAIDVGGNIGSFSIWLHHRHGLSEGHCFEPEPSSRRLCRFNLANNGCDAVTLHDCAVGGEARTLQMRVNPGQPGGNTIYGGPAGAADGREQVAVVSFSEWMSAREGEFDVLKLDCEGAEWEILDRTPPALWQRFRVVVAEIHLDPEGRHPVGDFAERLAEYGFQTIRWDGYAQGLYVGRREPSGPTP